MFSQKNQGVLDKKKLNGFDSRWNDRKQSNMLLSNVYREINVSKADRLAECSSWLYFRAYDNGMMRLDKASFCRVRLCPICSWRRSLKIFVQMRRILTCIDDLGGYRYIFLTLTVKNCVGVNLSDEIDSLMLGWRKFSRSKLFTSVVEGWYRGLEVTHNICVNSKSYDTYHPHFHCILVVRNSYFSRSEYVEQKCWQELWRDSMGLDYEPQVDIRCFKGNVMKSLLEATRYSVKVADYIIPDDWDLTLESVRILDKALDGRRFVSYGGLMKRIYNELRLDDNNAKDLVHICDESDILVGVYEVVRYHFSVGYNEYEMDD